MPPFPATKTARRLRAPKVYAALTALYPDIRCTLNYENPFQLLIMTMLAAQCTDARVNIVAVELFKRFPGPADFSVADQSEIEELIHSTGFFRQKAKSILQSSIDIMEKHDGEVPQTMQELTALRGVGRKTANVVLGECFGKQGVIVDTHCTRLVNRLGFCKGEDPRRIEKDLMEVWPPEHWTQFSHLMVFHGRAVCTARAPKCSQCALASLCPFPTSRKGKSIAR